jgi:hypothetical protein
MTVTSHVELKTCVRGATTNYKEPTLCTNREHLPDDLSITTRGRFGDDRWADGIKQYRRIYRLSNFFFNMLITVEDQIERKKDMELKKNVSC